MKIWITMPLVSLILMANSLAFSRPAPNWKTGQLELTNGMKLSGDLSYNWKAEIIQLRTEGTIKAYSAQQIRSFTYFDEVSNTIRRFSTVSYPVKKNSLRPVILEEFTSGPLTVYRRLRHSREPLHTNRPEGYNNDEVVVSDYNNFTYFVYTDDRFINLDRFSHTIWPLMNQEFGAELRRYAQVRQLDMSNIPAQLMLINQYNYLKMESSNEAGRTTVGVASEDED